MSKYKIYAKYTVTQEKETVVLDAESEFEAIEKAYDHEDEILNELRTEHNESVIFEEFIAVKIEG